MRSMGIDTETMVDMEIMEAILAIMVATTEAMVAATVVMGDTTDTDTGDTTEEALAAMDMEDDLTAQLLCKKYFLVQHQSFVK